MFDIGEYTLAPIKVAWHRFGQRIKAAVLEEAKPIIPQETHVLLACASSDEAWYLAGMLNSLPVEYALVSYSMAGGKSFASPNLFNYINFPRYYNLPQQLAIAKHARMVAAQKAENSLLDEAVAGLYGISQREWKLIKEAWLELGY
jgi:hypothetical protein